MSQEMERLYVKFGIDGVGVFSSGDFYIYLDPASQLNLDPFLKLYRGEVSPGKLAKKPGYPSGITFWLKDWKKSDWQMATNAISDMNRILQEQDWEKYSESRVTPWVGEFSYRRPLTSTAASEPAVQSDPKQVTELLRYLQSLKDEGVLTEAEFEKKKAEILKRL